MKNNKKLNFLRIAIFALALLLLICIFCFDTIQNAFLPNASRSIAYADFYALVQNGAVQSVTITQDALLFVQKNDAQNLQYATENPHSPLLEEFLLKNRVQITNKTNADGLVTQIFDALFYVIFFGALAIAFFKFIKPASFKVVRKTGVTFANVVGMDALKKDLLQIIDVMKNPKFFAQKGVRMPKGILLEGEPGNGKTLFARALAGEANVPFIATKATDFESMFMAIGPLKVKMLFAKARKKAPCIVFIDEFDGIGTKRNYSGSAIETENTRIVTALLNELDGFTPNEGILVIASTNSINALDSALIRPGRFDALYKIPYPDAVQRANLVERYLQGKNFAKDVTVDNLAKLFDGFSAAHIESVLNGAALNAMQAGRDEFCLLDVQQAHAQINM